MPVSESQKKAQTKYDREKTKLVQAKYTQSDMEIYEKLQQYVKETGTPINSLIKQLIKDFLESDSANEPIKKQTDIEKLYDKTENYSLFCYVSKLMIKLMNKSLGLEESIDVLETLSTYIEESIFYVLEENGEKFNKVVQIYLKKIRNGEDKIKPKQDIFYETFKNAFLYDVLE